MVARRKVVPAPPIPTPVHRRLSLKRLIKWFLIVIAIAVISYVGYVGYKLIRSTANHGGVFGLFSNHQLKGEASGHINILLAGNSADDPNHGGATLTDSIMVASINMKTNSVVTFSVPRDLWVSIPGHGYAKINTAYVYGGMGLLQQIIQTDFNIPIDYYALVDYAGFKDAVNAVGGITVNIQSPDPRGIYDPNISRVDQGPLILKNGVQVLNGQTALNLARARNDPTPSGLRGYGLPNGDFDRATNQRLMLAAIATKATSISTLSNPLKIGQLLDALGTNIHTNLQTSDLQQLYHIAKKLKLSSIKSVSLQNKVQNYQTSDGQAALIPAAGFNNYYSIQTYLATLMGLPLPPTPTTPATIEILNASGIAGLAGQTASILRNQGFSIAGVGNASRLYATSTVYDATSNAYTSALQQLKAAYNASSVTDDSLVTSYHANFVLVLGEDQSS